MIRGEEVSWGSLSEGETKPVNFEELSIVMQWKKQEVCDGLYANQICDLFLHIAEGVSE